MVENNEACRLSPASTMAGLAVRSQRVSAGLSGGKRVRAFHQYCRHDEVVGMIPRRELTVVSECPGVLDCGAGRVIVGNNSNISAIVLQLLACKCQHLVSERCRVIAGGAGSDAGGSGSGTQEAICDGS